MNKMRGEQEIMMLAKKIEAVKAAIVDSIRSLPDNPNIKRFGGKEKCFIMKFKHLEEKWTPEYYDFKYQYDLIARSAGRAENFF